MAPDLANYKRLVTGASPLCDKVTGPYGVGIPALTYQDMVQFNTQVFNCDRSGTMGTLPRIRSSQWEESLPNYQLAVFCSHY